MSPAKRKVAVSGRGGGKKRGVQKARGKARPAARKPRSSAEACDMPVSKLAAAFDRPESAGPLLSHVPGCGACTTSLTVLAASKQGLKHLTADAAGTAVERVLARGQAQGEKKLADLVYELVKACLVVVQDIDRRLHLEQRPRNEAIIRGEVRGVVSRLTERERMAAQTLPSANPSAERALTAADSCIQILEQVEGASDRQRLSRAVWLICNGEPVPAQVDLEHMLAATLGADSRLHVFRNLQWALNRQRNYGRAVEIGQRALKEFPSDWQLAYNLTVSSAGVGNLPLFRTTARQLTRFRASTPEGARFRRSVLAYEANRFAQKLGVPVSEVEAAFDVEALSAGGA